MPVSLSGALREPARSVHMQMVLARWRVRGTEVCRPSSQRPRSIESGYALAGGRVNEFELGRGGGIGPHRDTTGRIVQVAAGLDYYTPPFRSFDHESKLSVGHPDIRGL